MCQIAMKYMGKQVCGNEGIIVNVSSLLGVKVKPGLPVYCATKHGVIAFTRTMAVSDWTLVPRQKKAISNIFFSYL